MQVYGVDHYLGHATCCSYQMQLPVQEQTYPPYQANLDK